jgi:hypothetical protein
MVSREGSRIFTNEDGGQTVSEADEAVLADLFRRRKLMYGMYINLAQYFALHNRSFAEEVQKRRNAQLRRSAKTASAPPNGTGDKADRTWSDLYYDVEETRFYAVFPTTKYVVKFEIGTSRDVDPKSVSVITLSDFDQADGPRMRNSVYPVIRSASSTEIAEILFEGTLSRPGSQLRQTRIASSRSAAAATPASTVGGPL